MPELGTGIRPLQLPQPLAVEATLHGHPRLVTRRGRTDRVERILDSWRISDLWWRPDEYIERRYYEVILVSGAHLVVFRDELSGGWWEQRY